MTLRSVTSRLTTPFGGLPSLWFSEIRFVRIPAHAERPFRSKLNGDSGGC